MKQSKRLERNKQMLKYLATPVRYDTGDYMRDLKGNYLYPTLDDASSIWDISPERISAIKHQDFEEFENLKEEIRKQIEKK